MKLSLIIKSIVFFLFTLPMQFLQAENYELFSPNGKLKVKLQIEDGTQYELWNGDTQLIKPSVIGLNLQDGRIIGAGTVKDIERNNEDNIIPVFAGRNKEVKELYNEIIIHFNEGYKLVFRAYDEGIGYRFRTELDEDIIIKNEDAIFNFPEDVSVYFPACDGFDNWERNYDVYTSIHDISYSAFSVSPILFTYKDSPVKVVVTEADTYDYPGLYIERNGDNSMRGMWAKYPETVERPYDIYSTHFPITRFDYIVNTTGTRAFPWRVIIVSEDDKSLLNNNLVYLLAEPRRLTDTSWITPGKSTWEWWHKAMLEGVDFPVGNDNLGFDLYKYYVDFASANNLEFLTLDAGAPEGILKRLCAYATPKNVKIIVWCWASLALEDLNYIPRMKSAGVYGLKIDFFNRSDQPAMTWGHILAEKLAEHEMVAIFHGNPMPTGLDRTYPNILNFEAVRGAECNFWDRGSDPLYHVQFPFIRLLAGPADYTPGSLRNVTKNQFAPVDRHNTIPSSMGTRAHEMAMYVVFDHWLGFLCDAPTEYEKYPDILDFLSTVPAVWDKTLPLDAKLGEYILTAKQTGKDWYVGGMSNWDTRTIDVDFSFLEPGIAYKATIIKDQSNSDNYPKRTDTEELIVTSETKLSIRMAKGGGFAIRLIDNGEVGIDNSTDIVPVKVFVDRDANLLKVSGSDHIHFITICDVAGKVVLQENNINVSNIHQVDISTLSKGVYATKVKIGNNIYSTKFIY